jgi:FkbM family methyltransferase
VRRRFGGTLADRVFGTYKRLLSGGEPTLGDIDVFPLERAIPHHGATITGFRPLVFSTPPDRWAYAVSLKPSWPTTRHAIHDRDGSIRLRLRAVEGSVSALALAAGTVIDEVAVDSPGPVDVDLVCVPLGICDQVVVRNTRDDGRPSVAELASARCVDLGPSEPAGDSLSAPPTLKLVPAEGWSRYYGDAGTHPLPERVRAARYGRLDRVKWMPWLADLKVCIYPNDELSRALYISGLYEPFTLLVLQRTLAPGATFIDLGANAGLFSMFASRQIGAGGHVFAFEPSAREYGRLLDHVRLNALSNVTPVPLAVGDKEGAAPLRVASFPNAGHNTMSPSFAYPDVRTEEVEWVTVETLDHFVRSRRVARVDVIKMDIEGSEYAALSGGTEVLARFRPVLILELEPRVLEGRRATVEDVLALLAAARYVIHRIGPEAELIRLAPGEVPPEGNVVALPYEHVREQGR